MRRYAVLAVLAAVGLAACAGTDRYPMTREKAGPNDAVLTMAVPPIPEILAP